VCSCADERGTGWWPVVFFKVMVAWWRGAKKEEGRGVDVGMPHGGGRRKERRGAGAGSTARPCSQDSSGWHCRRQ
jgi:hypothetical protein